MPLFYGHSMSLALVIVLVHGERFMLVEFMLVGAYVALYS